MFLNGFIDCRIRRKCLRNNDPLVPESTLVELLPHQIAGTRNKCNEKTKTVKKTSAITLLFLTTRRVVFRVAALGLKKARLITGS